MAGTQVLEESAAPEASRLPIKQGLKGVYRPDLDAVRFFAFLLVFVHHILPRGGFTTASRYPLCARLFGEGGWPVLTAFANGCGAGLCLFFTLSAYLITRLLLDERDSYGNVSVRDFYARRILRIWPLYFFGVMLGLVWMVLCQSWSDATQFLAYLLFAGNIACSTHSWSSNPMTPLWSISIEEQFYLIWPLAVRSLSRRSLVICALFTIGAANVALAVLGSRHANVDYTVWTNTFVQFQMFATGVLLALWRMPRLNSSSIGVAAIGVAFALWFSACYFCHAKQPASPSIHVSVAGLVAGYGLFAMGCAVFLLGMCTIGPTRTPAWVAWLGKRSYGLYVYHLLVWGPVSVILSRVLPGPVIALIALALTIAVAAVSYRKLELPFLEKKKRFERVSGISK